MIETDFISNGNVTERKNNTINRSQRPLKITVVGDDAVGKTCMLIKYTFKDFPEEYIPNVFGIHPCVIKVDNFFYAVTLYDTEGQEGYEGLRLLSYPFTTCFILCYSINSKSSYDNIVQKWYPELKHHCPSVPIILVGTKSDLRGSEEERVTQEMAKEMQQKISACKVMECSALENIGMREVFIEAVRCAVKYRNGENRANHITMLCSGYCTVL